jgi:hypothetical protein
MSSDTEQVQPSLLGPEDYPEDQGAFGDHARLGSTATAGVVERGEEPLQPINWNLLTADEAEAEWLDLNAWVNWLRMTYGLPPTVVPPFWHRHDELVWELSALHTHWLNAYDPDGSPSAPLAWHRDFADARTRLREWVSTCGTKLDRDRLTRLTVWPGEDPIQPGTEVVIDNRDADFVAYVLADVATRRRIEEQAGALVRAS